MAINVANLRWSPSTLVNLTKVARFLSFHMIKRPSDSMLQLVSPLTLVSVAMQRVFRWIRQWQIETGEAG